MRWLTDPANSGIFVLEGPAAGQPIPTRRETITAFLGPAPRGPVAIPVAVRSVGEYLQRFGSPNRSSRLEHLLTQFFDNGGTVAVVVRVCRSSECNEIALPGPGGALRLTALNPGPLECLRASVDYDSIGPAQRDRFNLVIHRLNSPNRRLVEEQEIYRNLSVDPADPDYVGHALLASSLVRLSGEPPAERPERTLGLGVSTDAYIYTKADWRSPDSPTDYDLIGSEAEGTGLLALEQIPILDLLCVVPGAPDADLGPVILFAAERYCRKRNALLLVDPPAHWTTINAVTRSQREQGFTSPNVVTYFPAPRPAPESSVRASVLGAIAGQLVAADHRHGRWSPLWRRALTLHSRERVARILTETESRYLARLGINPLRPAGPGRLRLEGLVTLARGHDIAADWSDLSNRRTKLFIIDSVMRGTRWAAFQRNEPETRVTVSRQVADFLHELWNEGALIGSSAEEAFFIRCDADTNPDMQGQSGQLNLVMGFAPHRSGEFLVFRFEHDRFHCRVKNLGWQSGVALAG